MKNVINSRGCYVERTPTEWNKARFVGTGCGYWQVTVCGLVVGRLHRTGTRFILFINDKRRGLFATQASALDYIHRLS
ncbi:hypothetical protein G3C70_004691 [Salmonella enterica]|nr:hypothetical protein [Salmonella enterica]